MSFDQIYNTQKKVMARIDNYVDDLEGYLKDLNSIVNEINSSWKSDAGEKYYIIKAIQEIRVTIGKNIRKYRGFTASSRLYLEQMHQFNKYNGACASGVCTVSNIKAVKSNKTAINIDTTKMKAISTKLRSVIKKIDNTLGQINAQINNVDSTIATTVAGGVNVLKGYKNSITAQNDRIRIIAININTIAKNYDKAETDIQKVIDNIDNTDINANEVADKTAEEIINMCLNITGIIGGTENNVKTDLDSILDRLKNIFDKIDEGVCTYEDIEKFLESLTNEELKIPGVTTFLSYFNEFKEYKDLLEKIANGEYSFKDLDALKEELISAVKGKAEGTGAEYIIGIIENLDYDGKGSFSDALMDAFCETIYEEAYEKIEDVTNIVSNGGNAIYNAADYLAENYLGIDLDAEYEKLGVNIPDTLEKFSLDYYWKTVGGVELNYDNFKGVIGDFIDEGKRYYGEKLNEIGEKLDDVGDDIKSGLNDIGKNINKGLNSVGKEAKKQLGKIFQGWF